MQKCRWHTDACWRRPAIETLEKTMGAVDELPLLTRHRLTVAEYYRMAEAGVLAPDARVELIEGEVIDMATVRTRHARTVRQLTKLLVLATGDLAIVSARCPLRIDNWSEPEPDFMLLKPSDDDYGSAHPTPADVLLLIEVSDSSARYDREIKLPLYARHGVAEVWMIDLYANCVRFFRRPEGGQYQDITSTETPGPTPIPGLPGTVIDLQGVLG
jgi:Uma2 family endonuclease